MATVIGRRLATLHELDSVYGTEDLYDLLEVLQVEAINEQRASDYNKKRNKGAPS